MTLVRTGTAGCKSPGIVDLNGRTLEQGDCAALSDEKAVIIQGAKDSEVRLFDLA